MTLFPHHGTDEASGPHDSSAFDGIVAWAQTRQTNGFFEAIIGSFQAAKRKARDHTRLTTMRTVIFLIAGKLDFQQFNPHAA